MALKSSLSMASIKANAAQFQFIGSSAISGLIFGHVGSDLFAAEGAHGEGGDIGVIDDLTTVMQAHGGNQLMLGACKHG